MKIPILNIYYMLIYAWDVLDEANTLSLRAEDCTQLVDLFARVLHSGTEAALRRGLDRGYIPHQESIAGVRGKLDISASVKINSFPHARAVCEFDELTHDVQHNRILKSTIRKLLNVPDLSSDLRDELGESHYRLHQIAEIDITDRAFRSVQLNRNNKHYKLLMAVCKLIHDAGLVTEETGEREFRDFFRDDRRMRVLFERFIRNFYRREQREFRVSRSRMRWTQSNALEMDLPLLPTMTTDVTLESDDRVIVIETKFTPTVLTEYQGKQSLRSSHLYQLFAYLRNYASRHANGNRRVDGILLYPIAVQRVESSFQLHGHNVSIFTLDLDQRWQDIRDTLLALLAPNPSSIGQKVVTVR